MPVIAQRRCRFQTASDSGAECHGHGACDEQGVCQCSDGYDASLSCKHRPPLDPVALFLRLTLPTSLGVLFAIFVAWRARLYRHHRRKKRLVVMLRKPEGGFAFVGQQDCLLPAGATWATFLSHCWSSGQDQVRCPQSPFAPVTSVITVTVGNPPMEGLACIDNEQRGSHHRSPRSARCSSCTCQWPRSSSTCTTSMISPSLMSTS